MYINPKRYKLHIQQTTHIQQKKKTTFHNYLFSIILNKLFLKLFTVFSNSVTCVFNFKFFSSNSSASFSMLTSFIFRFNLDLRDASLFLSLSSRYLCASLSFEPSDEIEVCRFGGRPRRAVGSSSSLLQSESQSGGGCEILMVFRPILAGGTQSSSLSARFRFRGLLPIVGRVLVGGGGIDDGVMFRWRSSVDTVSISWK